MVTIVLGKDLKKQCLASCHHPLLSVSYLYVPSLPSQPQEGPGSPKHWYYLCAPHLCPLLCWNLAHPTKGNRWCTTVHGMTSVSVGRQLMVNTVADACHVPWWRMHKWKWRWCLDTGIVSHHFLLERCLKAQWSIIKAWWFFICRGYLRKYWSWFNIQRHVEISLVDLFFNV